MPDGLTRLGGTLVFLGALVAAVSQAVAGLAFDQGRAVAGGVGTVDPGDLDTVETLDLVSHRPGRGGPRPAGRGPRPARRRSGEGPGDDPWDGHTLEWATSSPPAIGHFASLPPITSEALYDARHAAHAAATDSTEASS